MLVSCFPSLKLTNFSISAASETENPRRNIAKAVRRVFYRIVVFYILGILVTGMIVPYNSPALLQDTGTGAQSPVCNLAFCILLTHTHHFRLSVRYCYPALWYQDSPAHHQCMRLHLCFLCRKLLPLYFFSYLVRPRHSWTGPTHFHQVHQEWSPHCLRWILCKSES